jgi:hypothetical protein
VGEWRTIGQLADLVGGYCWVEDRLFTLTGEWASDGSGEYPEITVFLATQSRLHGASAEAWRDRLPVRASVDRSALITPPVWDDIPVQTVLERLAEASDPLERLAGLTEVVLPLLVLGAYQRHADSATAVAEAPVRAVLEVVMDERGREMVDGRSLWQQLAGVASAPVSAQAVTKSLLEGMVRE